MAILRLRNPIGHYTLVYDPTTHMQYNPPPWKPPLNNITKYGFIVQYNMGIKYQQMRNRKQKHKEIKDDFGTMAELNNQLKNQIDLTIEKNHLKGVRLGTIGFVNYTNLLVLQYLFNTLGWSKLGDKEQNDEKMRNLMNPVHPSIGSLYKYMK